VRYGIGVRYNEQGYRLLKLMHGERGLKITGLAAGPSQETMVSMLQPQEGDDGNPVIATCLGPGQFYSSFIVPEDGMDGRDMEAHLRWEIERKIMSDPANYTFDFIISDSIGCVFAGRKDFIAAKKALFGDLGLTDVTVLTDVESVALYNGCEGAGEIGADTVVLVSLEAEGISTLVMENGALSALESLPIDEASLLDILSGLDNQRLSRLNGDTSERMAGHVVSSLERLTSLGKFKDKPTPKQIVLAGAGVYIADGAIADFISQKAGIPTTISNPLKPLMTEVPPEQQNLMAYSAAFTTCFGLALRALED
jgi:Tfp pilus assembly PilM family ATPase